MQNKQRSSVCRKNVNVVKFHNQYVLRATAPSRELTMPQTVFAGAAAGLAELLCLFPLDTVKTRMQLMVGMDTGSGGILSSLKSLVKEGGVSRVYRGILAPALQEPIKRATKFTSNAQYRKIFPEQNLSSNFLCGAMAGMTEACSIAPFEVVKVRMQAANHLSTYNNSWQCALSILQTEGVRGLARGLSPAVMRSGMWNGPYFGCVWYCKTEIFPLDDEAGRAKTMGRNFVCGLIGGILGTTFNNPFDVVVSRVRNVLPGEPTPYRFTLPSMVHIAQNEGIRALYKGYSAKVLRLGPGGGIMMCAFDLAKTMLLDDDGRG
jgi:solute carrier family 25 (mitochondrial 2-oxodicarboxylate transporter), member 21